MVPWVCLQCVIVVFPDHIHLLFLFIFQMKNQALFSFLKKQHNLKMSLGQIKINNKCVNYIFFLTEMPFKMLFFRKPEKY